MYESEIEDNELKKEKQNDELKKIENNSETNKYIIFPYLTSRNYLFSILHLKTGKNKKQILCLK